MKILFLSDVPLENPVSGAEQVLNQQATGLARVGMDVYAITRQKDYPPLIIRNVAGVREGSYRAPANEILKSSICLLKYPSRFFDRFNDTIPFQAVICHQPFNCFSLFIRKRIRNVPMIYVFHSPSHKEYKLLNEDKNFLSILPHAEGRRMIECFCIKKAQKILALSHYMKEKVQDIHGISSTRIDVNPGGVDLDQFKPPRDRNAARTALGFAHKKVHLFTVRNLEPRMGIDNLLKAIFILKRRQLDVHLIVGGEGVEQRNLERLILEYGLVDDVTMTGFIPLELLPQYYGAADFFILPTRLLEGFGLVTPESMACGTPVLGTPVGGTKEILSGFDPKFLFRDTSPDAMADGILEAIDKYLVEKRTYDELRFRCRKYAAENYSWKRHTDQLISVLEEAL
jgi:glycosyltransferase involved in cell wall biosynthesis